MGLGLRGRWAIHVNFAITEFYEVRLKGFLGKLSLQARDKVASSTPQLQAQKAAYGISCESRAG
jgi:hypothetical protein